MGLLWFGFCTPFKGSGRLCDVIKNRLRCRIVFITMAVEFGQLNILLPQFIKFYFFTSWAKPGRAAQLVNLIIDYRILSNTFIVLLRPQ